MLRLAIVGDIHSQWGAEDAADFARLAYDRVLVVGDLAGLRWSGTLAVAKQLGEMIAPAVIFPGNHDASHPLQLLAEVAGRPAQGNRLSRVQSQRLESLRDAVHPHILAGYSAHALSDSVTLIAGRPHSMGGPTLSFPGHLEATWGVDSLEASAAKMCALVDEAETQDVVFMSHNGPAGLGATRTDIWGCDFKKEEGDWGDPDLTVAIAHARGVGKRVRAVVAGHMHRKIRGGGSRAWMVEHDGTLYVNAAEVPRVKSDTGRHHVCLTLEEHSVVAADVWVR